MPKIFTPQPRLTKADRLRLAPHLSGWNRLVRDLQEFEFPCDDFKRMVLMELERDKPRQFILDKLVAQVFRADRERIDRERETVKERIAKCTRK